MLLSKEKNGAFLTTDLKAYKTKYAHKTETASFTTTTATVGKNGSVLDFQNSTVLPNREGLLFTTNLPNVKLVSFDVYIPPFVGSMVATSIVIANDLGFTLTTFPLIYANETANIIKQTVTVNYTFATAGNYKIHSDGGSPTSALMCTTNGGFPYNSTPANITGPFVGTLSGYAYFYNMVFEYTQTSIQIKPYIGFNETTIPSDTNLHIQNNQKSIIPLQYRLCILDNNNDVLDAITVIYFNIFQGNTKINNYNYYKLLPLANPQFNGWQDVFIPFHSTDFITMQKDYKLYPHYNNGFLSDKKEAFVYNLTANAPYRISSMFIYLELD